MGFHAKSDVVKLDGIPMEYIRFGTGEKTLIMLPGLGDGLRSVKGTALPVALMYRIYAKDYTVYMFSRKRELTRGYTIGDMARDQAKAMEQLGIGKADFLGVSMGGMIAQQFAIDYPEKVQKLVLVVTASRTNPLLSASVREWMLQAEQGDHTALMDSNMRKIYSDAYYRQNQWMIPVLGKVTKPKSYERFLVQANACLTHDTYEKLHQIQAPTLVIGGAQDQCLGGEASQEIAARIPNADLHMYDQWGHGLYEEAKDFQQVVLRFLRNGF